MLNKLCFDKDEHRTMHFKTIAKVVYDPARPGKKEGQSGWCVIELPSDDLAKYYSYQFYKKFGIILDKPEWNLHLSVIKGSHTITKNKEDSLWKYRDGEDVVLNYSHYLFWNAQHVWINAFSSAAEEIRSHYIDNAMDRGHITIGRIPQKHKNTLPEFSNFNDLRLWNDFPFNSPLI